MSMFYGQVEGQAETIASRRGSRNSGIKTSAQSWEGSVIVRMHEGEDGEPRVDIQISNDSDFWGQSYFYGTIDELKTQLEK